MTSEALEALTTEDQRSLDPSVLQSLLREIEQDAEPSGFWVEFIEWLKETLLAQDSAQNEWLETFGAWLLRYAHLFEYFFYATVILCVILALYLLWSVLSGAELPMLRRARSQENEVGPPAIDFASSRDPLIQLYVRVLHLIERDQLAPHPFSLSPRELAQFLSASSSQHPIACSFQSIARGIDGYLYGNRGDQNGELKREIELMLSGLAHE